MRLALLPAELGLQLRPGDEAAAFGWFLASFLAGKRIGQGVAARTWQVIVRGHGCTTAARLCASSHGQLVRMLGEGGYRRYDQSTATMLRQLCDALQRDYDGRILGVLEASTDRADFERRLLAFRGVGPVTLRIFMKQAGPVLFPPR